MKVIQVLSTAMLFLLPGAIVPAYAQEHEPEKQPAQKQEQAKPAPQQAKPAPQQAKPAAQPQRAQQQAKPAPQQAKPAAQPQRAQQQAKPAPQQAKPAAQPERAQQQAKPAAEPQRAQQQARPAQGGSSHGRIPDDRYNASFGSGHTFHVNRGDFAGGGGRFQYGGFWFSAVGPWPVGWLYTDSVYVDYMNGGYFLVDPIHPGVFLSINVAI
jgi:hypothetical protein